MFTHSHSYSYDYFGSPLWRFMDLHPDQTDLSSTLWRFITLVNDKLLFILLSWISKWRTNCFRGTSSFRFSTLEIHYFGESYISSSISFYYLGSTNGEPTVSGLGFPLWRSITLVNEIFYFILASWISKL